MAASNLISYGPDENCTLTPGPFYCPPSAGVYEYRPSLSTNIIFIAFFFIAMIIHIALGIKYRTWAFLFAIFWGCTSEVIGYGGRVMLWESPFSFPGFLIQIICITLGPAFYSAAIYLTLSKIIIFLGPQYARFSPRLYYWMFIPCDLLSLVLQAVGGALSSITSGGSKAAVNVSLAGLSFQVFTLCIFISLSLEFAVRYIRARRVEQEKTALPRRFKVFVVFLSMAIIFILIRCSYRIDELSDGYLGPLIHNEPLFVALEGSMSVLAVYSLVISHPGPIFGRSNASIYESNVPATSDSFTEKADPESLHHNSNVPATSDGSIEKAEPESLTTEENPNIPAASNDPPVASDHVPAASDKAAAASDHVPTTSDHVPVASDKVAAASDHVPTTSDGFTEKAEPENLTTQHNT